MGNRILTLQRQMRELGRLRCGYSEIKPTRSGAMKPQPVKSPTWILSSKHKLYLEAAVELGWGTEIETWTPQGQNLPQWRLTTTMPFIDALLPPGDPITQWYEMWTGGGCSRRCDGEREQLSNQDCLCRAQFDKDFHTRSAREVCKIYTRLGVILPQLPDVGLWQIVTKGFYSGQEIPAQVDLIRYATGGTVAVPVSLGIEQRTDIDEGKRKDYQVVVLQVRGAVMGPMLTAAADRAAIEAGGRPQRREIEARPNRVDSRPEPTSETPVGEVQRQITIERLLEWVAVATTLNDLNRIRAVCVEANIDDPGLLGVWKAKGQAIKQAQQQPTEPAKPIEIEVDTAGQATIPAGTLQEGDRIRVETGNGRTAATVLTADDRIGIWMQVLPIAGIRGWDSARLDKEFADHAGVSRTLASADDMQQFLLALQAGEV